MTWQLMVGLAVLLYSINGLLHRSIMKNDDSDAYAQAFAFTALVSLFFLVVFVFRPYSVSLPSPSQWVLSLISALFSCAGMVLVFKGFKTLTASEHTIVLTSCQVWGALGTVLFLHESLTINKLIGTVAIICGIVLAEWQRHALVMNRGGVYVLLAALAFAGSGTASYFIVRNFDVLSYMMWSSIIVTFILFAGRPNVVKKLGFYFRPRRAANIVVASINDSVANILGLAAYQVGRNALQIGPIMATQTLVIVLLAAVILRERDRILQKIV